MKPLLQTGRLSFRDLTVEDYDDVHVHASDPEVTRYTAFGPNTPEQKGLLAVRFWRVVADRARELQLRTHS
jgi:hypothetical protein